MAAVGLLVDDPRLMRTGMEIVETAFFVERLTGLGKRMFGRSRPHTDRGSTSFKFWGGTIQRRRSFPSDSVASAFALAVPIAEEYPGTIWPYVVYGLASLSAIQRVVDDAH